MISARQAIQELGGEVCHGCDGAKERKKSHCRKCYFSLPRTLRTKLYNQVGAGYEEAYEESLTLLRLHNKRPARATE